MVGVSKVRGDAFREDTSSANIAIQAFAMTASTFAHCSTTTRELSQGVPNSAPANSGAQCRTPVSRCKACANGTPANSGSTAT